VTGGKCHFETPTSFNLCFGFTVADAYSQVLQAHGMTNEQISLQKNKNPANCIIGNLPASLPVGSIYGNSIAPLLGPHTN